VKKTIEERVKKENDAIQESNDATCEGELPLTAVEEEVITFCSSFEEYASGLQNSAQKHLALGFPNKRLQQVIIDSRGFMFLAVVSVFDAWKSADQAPSLEKFEQLVWKKLEGIILRYNTKDVHENR